jgi:hypothetical protein
MLLDYWKPIKGYEEKYSVSYCGGVRSLNRIVNGRMNGKRFVSGKILRPCLDIRGYLYVNLYNKNGKMAKKIHRLVAETFVSNPNNYPQVNHMVGVKPINFVPNLEWCTSSYNLKHAFANGLKNLQGENHPNSKLTNKQVIEIKTKLLLGQRNVDLAKEYGVNADNIHRIKKGKRWGHINV